MEVWPEPAQLHQGIRVCTAVPGTRAVDPELDCGGVARAGTAVPGYQSTVGTAVPDKKEADPELDCGGVARAGTAALGYQSVYCFTWQNGGGSGAGLWRCGQSRHSCTRVSVCGEWSVLLLLLSVVEVLLAGSLPENYRQNYLVLDITHFPFVKNWF